MVFMKTIYHELNGKVENDQLDENAEIQKLELNQLVLSSKRKAHNSKLTSILHFINLSDPLVSLAGLLVTTRVALSTRY